MGSFERVKEEIKKILPNSPIEFDPVHSELVLKNLLKLKPDADEAFQIAALGHDIDRAVHKITEKDLTDFSKIDEFKKQHSLRSAKIVADILKKYGYDEKFVQKVSHLIENHEFGLDEDSRLLMDADSLAYFEYNIPFYLKRNGRERTKEKIKFMYIRMSEKTKRVVDKMTFDDGEIAKLFKETIYGL
ncbi:MAG: HD domain-containing protein [Candidatus Paceibacterota bacterium]|jgi:hypothetical protein